MRKTSTADGRNPAPERKKGRKERKGKKGRKEGKKEGRKERKEGRKERKGKKGGKEGRKEGKMKTSCTTYRESRSIHHHRPNHLDRANMS